MKMRAADFDKRNGVGAAVVETGASVVELEAQWRPDPVTRRVHLQMNFAVPQDRVRAVPRGWIITGVLAMGAVCAALTS